MGFPINFVWGAAAAAHQIEGAAFEDGKGASIWDTYAHDTRTDIHTGRTNIKNLDHADVACDHYHRYKEDVALMKQIGLKAYRFSISWSRVLPEGRGTVNEKGLAFYSDLVDELLAAGIEPYITLFHWDLPQALQDIGGWANPEMPGYFAEYVKVVVDALSDRVTWWMTFNEPQCHIIIGHVNGECAPKQKVSYRQAFYMMHHLFIAHGKAVQIIRSRSKKKPMVGYAPNPVGFYPCTDGKEDVAAARKAAFDAGVKDLWCSAWWLDPVLKGAYPQDGISAFGTDFPQEMIREGDMELISQPLDYLGCNLYTGKAVRSDRNGSPILLPPAAGYDRTAFHWPVTPAILRYMPQFLYDRYRLPILITENGMSNVDWISLDGKVHDPQRIDFLQRYLLELEKALEENVPILGYLTWSVMDNYEWSDGFGERFGLIHVDYLTQKRTLKDSALWYKEVIESNGMKLR